MTSQHGGSEPAPINPSSPLLDHDTILACLNEVDAELPEGPAIEIIVIGGAALSLRHPGRATQDFDIITDQLPGELLIAAAVVAERRNLALDWLNNAAADLIMPDLDPQLETVYRGNRLTVYSPGPQYLLATKLIAGRDADIDDAVNLARETGITSTQGMLELLSSAYPTRLLTPRAEQAAHQVARLAQGDDTPPVGYVGTSNPTGGLYRPSTGS